MTTARLSLVTGANKGIGFETARQLGRAGHQVLVGARDPERGRRAVERLEAEGLDVRLRVLDVADPASIAAAARSVERDFGRLDVLVNNAAVGLVRVPPSEVDAADLRAVLDTNFFGAVETVKAFLPLLRASDAGRIVNVSSALGSISNLADPDWKAYQRLFTPYSVSKAALNAFTAMLSAELIDTEIKVNAVEPGFTATDMTQQRGPRTPEQAARVVVRYATLASSGPTGGYFDESGRLAW